MYTSHGYMTSEDYAEYLEDTDQTVTVVYLDEPLPVWFTKPDRCLVCPEPTANHISFTVQDASGEIIDCSERN